MRATKHANFTTDDSVSSPNEQAGGSSIISYNAGAVSRGADGKTIGPQFFPTPPAAKLLRSGSDVAVIVAPSSQATIIGMANPRFPRRSRRVGILSAGRPAAQPRAVPGILAGGPLAMPTAVRWGASKSGTIYAAPTFPANSSAERRSQLGEERGAAAANQSMSPGRQRSERVDAALT